MKKFAVLPIAALLLAACSEGPVGVEMGPQFTAEHGTIPAPSIPESTAAAAAVGTDVTISWTWQDSEDPWDLVSFTLKRDGVKVSGEIDNAKPYDKTLLQRSHTDEGVADGTYLYCVEVMAKYKQQEGPEITKHSKACKSVTVGNAISFTHAIDNALSSGNTLLVLQDNAGRWDFVFGLAMNGVAVNCNSAPVGLTSVSMTGTAKAGTFSVQEGALGTCHEGDPTKWLFKVNNPSKDAANDGTFSVHVIHNGVPYTTVNSAEEWKSVARGGQALRTK